MKTMAMKDVMGIIYTGEKDGFLRELTTMRAIAAVPVAGRYRVIDFLVSSFVNSDIPNVGVIMQKNYHSLMDHLGSGKEWDLHGKTDGLFILPPFLTAEKQRCVSGVDGCAVRKPQLYPPQPAGVCAAVQQPDRLQR